MKSAQPDSSLVTKMRRHDFSDRDLMRTTLLAAAYRCMTLGIWQWNEERVIPFELVFLHVRRYAPLKESEWTP